METRCVPAVPDSSDRLALSLRILLLTATPLHVYGFFCLLHKCPDVLNSLKCNLIHLHSATVLCNYAMNLLVEPCVLLPAMAGFPLGILDNLKLGTLFQIYTLLVTFSLMGVSTVALFEARLHVLFATPRYMWGRVRFWWLAAHYFFVLLAIVFSLFDIPEQETSRKEVFQSLPCLTHAIQTAPVFVLAVELSFLIIAAIVFILTIISEVVFFTMLIFLLSAERLQSGNISQTTFRNQNVVFLKLFLQVVIPLFTLIVPLLYAAYSIGFKYHNQFLNNFLVVFLASTHGITSSFVMIAAFESFRKQLIFCFLIDNPDAQIAFRRRRHIPRSVISANLV